MKVVTDVRQKGKTIEAIKHISHLARMDYMDTIGCAIFIQIVCKTIREGKILAEQLKEELKLSDDVCIQHPKTNETLAMIYDKLYNSNKKPKGIYILVRRTNDVTVEELKGTDYVLVDDFKESVIKKERIIFTNLVK